MTNEVIVTEEQDIVEESGFTLVELLIVIVILGVLTAVVVFSVGGLRTTGGLAACKAQVKSVEIALEAYNARQGTYPATTPAIPNAGATEQFNPTGLPTAGGTNFNLNLTSAEAQAMLLHLVEDKDPAANAATGRRKLLKSVPAYGNEPAAGASATALASYNASTFAGTATQNPTGTATALNATNDGSFVTFKYVGTTPVTTNGLTTVSGSGDMQVSGYYLDGGLVKKCS